LCRDVLACMVAALGPPLNSGVMHLVRFKRAISVVLLLGKQKPACVQLAQVRTLKENSGFLKGDTSDERQKCKGARS
jgi:hypothetical protein